MVRALDHALHATLGFGLDVFGAGARDPRAPLGAPAADAPLLVLRTDEERSQCKVFQHLMDCGGLRMAVFRDPLHRDWNDCKLAIQKAGLWGGHLRLIIPGSAT